MQHRRIRRVTFLLVVAMVALSGCLGGSGGDGADPTPTPADPGPGDEDAGDNGGDGDAPDQGPGDDSDDGTDSAGDTGDDPVTATPDGGADTPVPPSAGTPAPPASPTPDDSGSSGDEPGDAGDGPDAFSSAAHQRAIRDAGSYTVTYTLTGFSDEQGDSFVEGYEEVDAASGTRYSSFTIRSDGEDFAMEYYLPPDSGTAYQRMMGETREVPADNADFFNVTYPGTGESSGEWPEFSEVTSGQTDLGSATRYVADDVADLPAETRAEYDDILNVEFSIWVDDDTGIIAKYDYRITYVEDGEEVSGRMVFELSDLASTTVEKPEWAP